MSRQTQNPYLLDKNLIPRIKHFLEDKKADDIIVPVTVASYLQERYRRDYGRQKKDAFILSVTKALVKARKEMFGKESARTPSKRSCESSSGSDPETLVKYEDTNLMNLALRDIYKKTAHKSTLVQSPQSDAQPTKASKNKKKYPGMVTSSTSNPSTPVSSTATPSASTKTFSQGPTAASLWTVDCVGSRASHVISDVDSAVADSNETGSFCLECRRPFDGHGIAFKSTPDQANFAPLLQNGQNISAITDFSFPYSDAEMKTRVSSVVNLEMDVEGKSKQVEREVVNKLSKKRALVQDEQDSGTPAAKEKVKKRKVKDPDLEIDTDTVLDVSHPTDCFDDFGGNGNVVDELEEICEEFADFESMVTYHEEMTETSSILLHGPSGSGKELLAKCMSNYLGCALVKPKHLLKLVSGVSGDSEQKIRDMFSQAVELAPCVLFLDRVEVVAPNQAVQSSSDMVKRMITQLCMSIEELKASRQQVLIVAATNNIGSVDKQLRDCFMEKHLSMPDEKDREAILKRVSLAKTWAFPSDFIFRTMAILTPGFVARDLKIMVEWALKIARKRLRRSQVGYAKRKRYQPPSHRIERVKHLKQQLIEENREVTIADKKAIFTDEERQLLTVTDDDFKAALRMVEPAAKREGFSTVPTTTWKDVGAVDHVKEVVESRILPWIHEHEVAEKFNLSPKTGILLYGPPGCGKTMVAKAMANEAGLNFIDVKGPELLNKYVGESERGLRQIFEKAQVCAPCLIFFDEIDALCGNRQDREGSAVTRQVTTQFLTLMDGCTERKQVFVMGATNILESLDSALLRPGRFDDTIYIGLPTLEGRVEILRALTHNGTRPELDESVDIQYLAEQTENFSGADLSKLVREASRIAFMQKEPGKYSVSSKHFEKPLKTITPSVSRKDLKKYKSDIWQQNNSS